VKRVLGWGAVVASIALACGRALSEDVQPSDASVDGGVESGAGTVNFCATVDAAFCADFDGENYVEGWQLDFPTGGTTSETTDDFKSVPRSLTVNRSTPQGTYANRARLVKSIDLWPGEVDLTLQFRVVTRPAVLTRVVALRFGSALDYERHFDVVLDLDSLSNAILRGEHVVDGGTGTVTSEQSLTYSDGGTDFSQWTSLRMHVTVDGSSPSNSSATLRLGNGPDAPLTLSIATAPDSFSSPVHLLIGLVNAGGSDAGSTSVRFDDVVLRVAGR